MVLPVGFLLLGRQMHTVGLIILPGPILSWKQTTESDGSVNPVVAQTSHSVCDGEAGDADTLVTAGAT